MRKQKIWTLLVLLGAIVMSGCRKAEYGVIDNSLYFVDAGGSSKAKMVSLEPTGADVNVLVRMAQLSDHDITVRLMINKQILDQYNEENSTGFELLPDFQLSDAAVITIPAGSISGMYKIHIKPFEPPVGKNYAIPLELGEVMGGEIEKSGAQSKFIYLIAKPLIVSVPVMKGADKHKIKAAPETPWEIQTPQWSLEFWARMDGYRKNNQAVFNLGSKQHEIYIRFGDANSPYNYLQIKTLSGQVNTASNLVDNTWYHWAFVYDGTTLSIYRNGKPDVKFDPPAPTGGVVRIDFVEMISSGTYFSNKCAMSQVRLWKTALSENHIKNNMYYSIDPANPNLIAYWPMDEGQGIVFRDITGHGHDATSTTENNLVLGWEPNVRFDR